MGEVVVSAGEPVAWVFGQCGSTANRAEAEFRAKKYGEGYVSPCFAAAPVVLPEEPPADLIEQMVEAIGPGDRQVLREAAESAYGYVRSWVAAGGETR